MSDFVSGKGRQPGEWRGAP